MTQPAAIIGAGLAGLIAGYAFPGVPILEAAPRGAAPHRALLRFRSDAVSRLTGIPFRKVRVRKGIWFDGAYRAPDVRLANLYARKCLDRVVGDRSIWDIDTVDRWVAPESLIEQMVDSLSDRISFGVGYDFGRKDLSTPIISTAPLAVTLNSLRLAMNEIPTLVRAPIWTRRWRVPLADAHQTVYFPSHAMATYRASITGDMLIMELRSPLADPDAAFELEAVCKAMGLDVEEVSAIDSGEQRFGKIVPLPDDERRGWLARLTIEAGIYSLGRFATWRNILLDDVVADAEVIRRMLRSAGATNFHALRASAGR